MPLMPPMIQRFTANAPAPFRLLALAITWLTMPLSGAAQVEFIPDTVELTDIQYFRSKEAGRLYHQFHYSDSRRGTDGILLLESALTAAQSVHDLPAQGLIETEIAKLYRVMQQPGLATDHVNRALALDLAMPPLSPLRQRMHRELAGFYADFGAFHLSLSHLILALEIDERRDPQPTARRFRHCSGVAIGYQNVGEQDSAILYYQRCVEIASQLPDSTWASSALNNMGMALQKMGRNDSALGLYRRALSMLDEANPVQWEFATHVRDNLGDALMRAGRVREALAVFEQNLEILHDQRKADHFKAGLRTVHCFLALGRQDAAAQELDFLKTNLWRLNVNAQGQFLQPMLEADIAVAAAQQDWREAFFKLESLSQIRDSTQRSNMDVNIATLEGLLLDKTAQYQRELGLIQKNAEASTAKSKFQTLLSLSGGLLLGLLLLTLLISYRRRAERNRARHEYETYQRELAEMSLKNERLEKAQLVQELEMRQRDITDYALVYSQRKKILEEVLEGLKQIKRSPNPERSLQDLMIALKGKMDGEGLLHLEAQHIEQVNHAFFDKLRQRFPNLGSSELELCGMIRLGYSAKDIAAIRNIAPASVRIAKTRMKKKMGLGPDVDLLEFLGRD